MVSHLVEAESWRRGQGKKRLLVGETDKPWGRKRLPPQLRMPALVLNAYLQGRASPQDL